MTKLISYRGSEPINTLADECPLINSRECDFPNCDFCTLEADRNEAAAADHAADVADARAARDW